MLNWLDTWLGLGNPSGGQYLWWSGFFADGPIIVAMVLFYAHRQCSTRRCLRFGWHPVKDTHYRTCHRHATRGHHGALRSQHRRRHPHMHELFTK